MARLKGVIVVMSTPMEKDGSIDQKGIDRLASFLVDKGVGGLWLLGSQGEDINITVEERKEVIRATAKVVDGRIPIIAGTGLTNVKEILEFIDDIRDVKISGVHYIYRDWKQSDERAIAAITKLANESVFPIWLYNNIKRGKEITIKMIKALKNHPNIHGAKYGSFYHGPFLKAAMEQTDNFQIISAGNFFLAMLCYGGEAGTNSSANFCPEEYVKLYNLFMEGRLKEAREQQFKILRFSSKLPRTDNGENSAETKYGLSLRGLCNEYVNPAYRTYTDEEREKYKKAVIEYGFEWYSSEKMTLK